MTLCAPGSCCVGATGVEAQNPDANRVCFASGRAPTRNPVYDQNQFGVAKVRVAKTNVLCVPSTKLIVSGLGGERA